MPKRKHRADKHMEVKAVVSLAVAPMPSAVGESMAKFYSEALKPVESKRVEMLSSIAELLTGEKFATPMLAIDLVGIDL